MLLARVLLDLGQTDRSMDQFQMVLRSDSLHVEALMGLSEVLARIRDRATALSLAKRAVAAKRDAETLERLSVAWLGVGQLENAQFTLAEAIALDPDRPTLHKLMGALQAARGDVAAAQTSLESDYGLAWYNLGTAYAIGGYIDLSREAYKRALDLSENSVDVLIALGNLELQRGDPHTAAERYKQALAQDLNLPSAQRGLVLAYRQAGDSAAAAQAIARFRGKASPPSTPAMNEP